MSTIFKKGKMQSDRDASFLISGQSATAMDNGSMVARGAIVAGNLDLYTVAAPTDVTAQPIYVAHAPEIVEINGYRIDVQDLTQFTNPANRPFRARLVAVGDEFVVTLPAFASAPAVADIYAYPVNGATTFTTGATIPATAPATLFSIIQEEDITTGAIGNVIKAYRLKCIKSLA